MKREEKTESCTEANEAARTSTEWLTELRIAVSSSLRYERGTSPMDDVLAIEM